MELLVRAILYFMIYSVIGYAWEVLYCSLAAKEFKNRGFLFGPYLPLWGFGAVLMLAVQQWLHCTEWWQVFLMAVTVCDAIEYLTSFVMEKIFHLRWWDYTGNAWLSINGRISFETSLGFGFGGLLMLSILQPIIRGVVMWLPFPAQAILAAVAVAGLLVDTWFSSVAAKKVGIELKTEGETPRTDLTTEIKKFAQVYYSKRVRKVRKLRKDAVKSIKRKQKQIKKQIKQGRKKQAQKRH